MSDPEVRIGITLGDPRGIGAEVAAAALSHPAVRAAASFVVVGWDRAIPREISSPNVELEVVGAWPPRRASGDEDEKAAGTLSGRAIERGVQLALEKRIDGLVTAPVSKAALAAAGYPFPGHTEFLKVATGASEVAMMMAAETTPLGGPLRMALLTTHIPLREVTGSLTTKLVETRARIAERALRQWWGLAAPRLALAGINPHASEEGRFGDEEERVLGPAMRRLQADGVRVSGIFPGDTVYGKCIAREVDAVLVPYHDVGLAVLKTLARDAGVNVTAGIPFPRTSPDHGTALDIAGAGIANPGSMRAAIELCIRFCRPGPTARPAPLDPQNRSAAQIAEGRRELDSAPEVEREVGG